MLFVTYTKTYRDFYTVREEKVSEQFCNLKEFEDMFISQKKDGNIIVIEGMWEFKDNE